MASGKKPSKSEGIEGLWPNTSIGLTEFTGQAALTGTGPLTVFL